MTIAVDLERKATKQTNKQRQVLLYAPLPFAEETYFQQKNLEFVRVNTYPESGLLHRRSGLRRLGSNVISLMLSSNLESCSLRVRPDARSVFLELILSPPMLWLPTLCSEEVSLPKIMEEHRSRLGNFMSVKLLLFSYQSI